MEAKPKNEHANAVSSDTVVVDNLHPASKPCTRRAGNKFCFPVSSKNKRPFKSVESFIKSEFFKLTHQLTGKRQ